MAASSAASVYLATAPRLSVLLRRRNARVRASSAASSGPAAGGGSYLDMWRKAVERERRSAELARRLQAPAEAEAPAAAPPVDVVERRTARFEDLLRVPREERDRVQRRQVIDRAAAALAAARAVLKEPPPAPAPSPEAQSPPPSPPPTPPQRAEMAKVGSGGDSAARGPDRGSRTAAPVSQSAEAEAARALSESDDKSTHGIHPDGSLWWKETGVEQRPDGVVCKWTVIRGVSADGAIEWEDKYWEASDRFDHKELGSEKSGRDAAGNVWREYWKESTWQDYTCGVMHMEKTADKWGQNGKGEQWQEQWFEHYDSTGTNFSDHASCSYYELHCSNQNPPNHPLYYRWGETYDGSGGSTKYTDKWAERSEGDGWSKWGDKWDEHFDPNGHGIKQGETWWAGKYGDRWNRTWGEQHNGSGWVHKYGRSSSGEHWDTHVPQETWYERFPHFGFYHCFENSVQLRSVKRQQPPRK
ncbi:hypothetical protein BAE44_0020428 [Dichanthelium oligosanthes]|uniref:Uncharacterized protein n=1 Tax=Dichanthelium oligosanthes TaxID=888268 RepID=A0A1E5V060_9POAL|nr:hypothetical protein BAE44_0020428 [Dichanthelium oligosanthes]